jgi:nucleoside-diphosphate-sugar epimerase
MQPLRAARAGRLFLPGGGRFPIAYTFVDNLADAVSGALRRTVSGVFNVIDGSMPYADFMRPYAEMASTRPRSLPVWLVRALAAAVSGPLRAAGWWSPFSPLAVDFLVHGYGNAPARAARANAELGWSPRVEFGEGIERTRRWLSERGLLG